VDVVCTGDYQPAEREFEISRRGLEVCLELGFPVSVLERSSLMLRDLDLVEDLEPDAGLIYGQMGRKGLESIENVGPRLAEVVEHLLAELSAHPAGCEQPDLLG
jgi:hypothetical protein